MAGVVRKIIQTPAAPRSIGPFSQAVLIDRTLYISGQVGFEPSTMKLVEGGVAAETEKVLKNIGAILEAAGATFNNVVKVTVLLRNMADFATVNGVYAKYFPKNQPARMAYQVSALPVDAQIEMEAVAVLGDITDIQ